MLWRLVESRVLLWRPALKIAVWLTFSFGICNEWNVAEPFNIFNLSCFDMTFFHFTQLPESKTWMPREKPVSELTVVSNNVSINTWREWMLGGSLRNLYLIWEYSQTRLYGQLSGKL